MRPKSTPLTRLAASAYELGTKARKLAYDTGLAKTVRVERPVISVGNITAGGAGKTPLTILLVERLQARGLKVCVLSRGYGAKEAPTDRPRIVCDGDRILENADRSGDEPQMIARRTKACVVTYPDRVEAAKLAIAALEPDVFVLDDGFQHWRLERDLNILVMDAREPLGNGELLPAGPLRESPDAVERAHLIAVNHGPSLAEEINVDFDAWAPHFEVVMIPESLESFDTEEPESVSRLIEQKLFLISAIARPERFLETVENLGANVIEHQTYRDHQNISEGELKRDFARAEELGADCILFTEKDAVRLSSLPKTELPVRFLGMSLQIHQGVERLDAALTRLLGTHGQ